MWIDTHCHLDAPEFAKNLPEVIRSALDSNVQAILLPAVKAVDCQAVRAIANQHTVSARARAYTLNSNACI